MLSSTWGLPHPIPADCRVHLERSTYTAHEDDASAVVCVVRVGVTNEDIAVLLESTDTRKFSTLGQEVIVCNFKEGNETRIA